MAINVKDIIQVFMHCAKKTIKYKKKKLLSVQFDEHLTFTTLIDLIK